MVCKIAFYTVLLSSLCFAEAIHAQKSPEELLDEINRLPASERQKKLEEGARKEGELVWYSTMNREDSLQLTRGFESQYPYINTKMISGGAPKTFNRIAAEYRAGSYLYDVTGYRAIFLNPSKKAALSITRVFLTAPLPAPLSLSLTRTSSRQRIIRNRFPRSSTKNTRASW